MLDSKKCIEILERELQTTKAKVVVKIRLATTDHLEFGVSVFRLHSKQHPAYCPVRVYQSCTEAALADTCKELLDELDKAFS
jgi:hypothetical protein